MKRVLTAVIVEHFDSYLGSISTVLQRDSTARDSAVCEGPAYAYFNIEAYSQ